MTAMDLDPRACYRAIATRDARFDGRLFVGVRTTGVYCRPICPARTPKREHVMFFPTAAAAQDAGFRPCLRCRPEAAPDFAAWRGTSNTVSRALSLIELGGLDDADVETLAGRLGLGERQLRRLFRQHLGASPIVVAQTRRVLLAKQLLHETALPMSDVALASGFGSIRRFNETFQRLFQRPPRALRRSGRASSSTQGAVSLQLRYKPPYDWASMLAFLRARAITGMEVVTGESYWRTIEVDGARGIVGVTFGPRHALRVTVHCPKLSALPVIIARLRRLFDLAADPQAIGVHLSEDPFLAPLVAARPGLLVPGAWDGFELAVRAILGQQISVTAAIKLAGRLVSEYGAPVGPLADHVEGLTRVFPTAARLAAVSPANLPMPRARATALVALAKAVVADLQIFRVGRSLDEVVIDLRALKGIGEWTAHYIAMRELREPDAFPFGDVGLLRALTGRDGRRPTVADVLSRAERWRPWRAYAAQHLWNADAGVQGTAVASRDSSIRNSRRPVMTNEAPATRHRAPAIQNARR
jgi:AraC family transcriptional regulator of adaptative response / DNA-3-methyladenine glycosylase II